MSVIQWEYDLVERAFCEQLRGMGWEWIEGDPDLPETTERTSSREVLLKGRLTAALRKLNLRDGEPWLDEARIARAIRDLEQAAGHRLMEINQSATELLLKGTVAEGLPGWDQGRPQPIRFIDFENWEENDFLVINQFKVELTSGRGHVIPDAVLFVNGIPVAVAEFKSPGIQSPMREAINQLLRYSNQRKELFPTLYNEDEGVERLFHTNQLLIASDFFEARAATIGAPPEAYLEWADTSPMPMSAVAEELGVIAPSSEETEAAQELAEVGPEQAENVGTPLFFRGPDRCPEETTGGVTLRSQQILVAGMLRPAHLLDLMRNFTVFRQVDGKTRKVVAHYQQFRAVHRAVERIEKGRTRAQGAERDERGGIIWHTQGSGKSLSMVFLVRKMRMTPRLNRFKVVVVTDRTDLEVQLRETARLSGETLRPGVNDEGVRESPTTRTQRILRESTPDIVFAMLQKYQDVARRDAADKVAMTIIRKEKKPGKDQPVVEKKVTFEESIHFEEFPLLNESEEILILVDEAHRSHTRTLHRNLRKALVAHDLLQAVARVNRTSGKKRCGYVVDYIGIARHLNEALKDYDDDDTEGTLIDITVELPKLLDRRARAVAVFTDRGITDLQGQVDACVQLLDDLRVRADFVNKLRSFYDLLNTLEHRPEVPGTVFRDAKLLGFINKVAANLYRDPTLDLLGVPEKVKALINAHVSARGVDPKIPPTTITDAEFERVLQAQTGSRARAAQMQHAARYHIVGFQNTNPAYANKMSKRLEEILQRFKDDWDALERELQKFVDELRQGDRNDFPNLDPKAQVPFIRLVLEEYGAGWTLTPEERVNAISTTLQMIERIRQEIRKVGFWKNSAMRELLTKALVRDLNDAGISGAKGDRDLAQRLVALAKANHETLTRP